MPFPGLLYPYGQQNLLEFHFRAGFFQLRLDSFGIVLGSAFLDSLRSAVDQFLCLFQAQASQFADNLDDRDLVRASFGQHNVKLGLLFSSGSASSSRSGSNGNRSSGGNAELLFESLNELGQLQDGQGLDILIFRPVRAALNAVIRRSAFRRSR